MLCQDYGVAISLAQRAQALAIRFSVPDVRSDALNTQAVSASAKDLEWAGQLRQALDIALAGGHHEQAARAYTNRCHIHACKREFAEAERYLVEASPSARTTTSSGTRPACAASGSACLSAPGAGRKPPR